MIVTLTLDADALARLEAEALRRGIAVENVVSELAMSLSPFTDSPARTASRLIGLGASSSGQSAADSDEMLADGFGCD